MGNKYKGQEGGMQYCKMQIQDQVMLLVGYLTVWICCC